MSTKPPDRFAMLVPEEQEEERSLPSTLELVDFRPGAGKSQKRLGGGAYDPYEKGSDNGDTARIRKPRTDLRKLSEWIKTTQQVKALREEDPQADKPPKR